MQMPIQIEVLDANDNSPEFRNLPARISLDENRVEPGVFRVKAVDRDYKNFGKVTFMLESEIDNFVINKVVGCS